MSKMDYIRRVEFINGYKVRQVKVYQGKEYPFGYKTSWGSRPRSPVLKRIEVSKNGQYIFSWRLWGQAVRWCKTQQGLTVKGNKLCELSE